MISNSEIKAAWISKLKASASITALVSQSEIRELEWKGTDFVYPNIRIKVGPLTPSTRSPLCMVFSSDVMIYVFSEEKSSKQADDIASTVADITWNFKGFTVGNISISGINLTNVESAESVEGDNNSWRSVVNLSSMVQRKS